ncbi:MAG: NAD-dependent epimerase/dehydratase family protein [Pirellulaceae bacterium]|nr:NAD-dependent epimerase/dehydratase family protein [Pirellulaceae bacterium]MDP7018900.1 NAD-dependent epimerase/dehydratase family protein [Pirellulaceae bacterium]
MSQHDCPNDKSTCWSCPAVEFKGHVDFRACGQAAFRKAASGQLVVECKRRPEIGYFDPMSITYDSCTEWRESEYGRLLKGMRVLILGMDGYLGWPLALKLAKLGCEVHGIDNMVRRKLVDEKGGQSVLPIESMSNRVAAAKRQLDVDIHFREMDLLDRESLFPYLQEVKPEAIVQFAEIPSAPYSMASVDKAVHTIENNVVGTLGLLFGMRDHAAEASLIKLGTMGEYGSPLTGRPLFEGLFPGEATLQYQGEEWSLGGELTPRDPVSFYHVSKVQGTFSVYEACKYWWLRSYDVMQGVIYGSHTDELAADPALNTRFDIDEWWGTVVNRFVAQTAVGEPMTIYGSGNQMRGYITLKDAMQCIVRLIAKPPEPGQYDVVNQVTDVFTVRHIAETVAKIGQREFGLDPLIQRLENPRVEAEEHPYEVIHEKLQEQFGFQSESSLEEEIRHIFKSALEPEAKSRIEAQRDVLTPRTRWSGEQKEMAVLETIRPAA